MCFRSSFRVPSLITSLSRSSYCKKFWRIGANLSPFERKDVQNLIQIIIFFCGTLRDYWDLNIYWQTNLFLFCSFKLAFCRTAGFRVVTRLEKTGTLQNILHLVPKIATGSCFSRMSCSWQLCCSAEIMAAISRFIQ